MKHGQQDLGIYPDNKYAKAKLPSHRHLSNLAGLAWLCCAETCGVNAGFSAIGPKSNLR